MVLILLDNSYPIQSALVNDRVLSTGKQEVCKDNICLFFKSDLRDFPGSPMVKNCIEMQGTPVCSLAQEDATHHRVAKLICHNY